MASTHITFEFQYFILALLGMLLHILMHIKQRKTLNNPFSIKVFISDSRNWIRFAISFISILALLMMAEEVTNILGITLKDGSSAKGVFAFFSGYLNHSLIRNLLKVFKK